VVAVTRIRLVARPASSRSSIGWDSWRSVWVVRVRERAKDGKANAAILDLLARELSVPRANVRWIRAGRGYEKVAEVSGVSEAEVGRRLGTAAQSHGKAGG